MSKKDELVQRPLRRTEYRLEFHSHEAGKGWRDIQATAHNATVDAWDRLTRSPLEEDSARQYRLKGDYACIQYGGKTYVRWQYKITNGGRIWYFVVHDPTGKHAGVVRLERCSPGHPKETDF